ncbi:MAG TPA: O-antigen ligase family protein [Vicinamibacterales bacterium]|nr:O-antigen ligase family protein [Vicinamibacterales bacterium]
MSSTVRDRTIDVVIAGTLALLPLLPAGPTYFGWRWPWALEAAFLAAATLAVLVVLTIRGRVEAPSAPRPLHQVVSRGYLMWLIPIAGATIIGLLERNPPDLALFRIQAEGLMSRLAAPMNQAADPLYPLRVGLTVLEGGLMFLLLTTVLRRTDAPRRRAQAAIAGCLVAMTIVSVVAVVQYVTRANLHHYWVSLNPNLTRSHATLDDPNALASFLVLGIGLAAGVAWASNSLRRRALALGAAALACGALLTTVSRGGVAALGIAAVFITAVLPDRVIGTSRHLRGLRLAGRRVVMAVAIAVVAWGIAFAVLPKHATTSTPETPVQALLQTVDPRLPVSTLLKGRHLLWDAGLQVATEYWIAGAGLGQFPRLVAGYPGAGGAENAHNYFLQVFAEGGIVAFAGLLALLGAIAWTMSRAIGSSDLATARLALGLSVGVVAFVLTWLTGHPLLTLSNQLWFATVLAVGLAAAGSWRAVDDRTAGAPDAASLESGTRTHSLATDGPRAFAGPAWLLVVVLITLAASGSRALDLVRSGARRPHAVGVYGWEPAPPSEAWPAGTAFRWTRARAAVREPVGGRTLLLPVFMARPDIDMQAVVVDVTIAGVAVPPWTFTKNGWHVHTYDLAALVGEDRWRSQRTVTVEFRVRPTVVPAQAGPSSDTRELGIGVGALRWQQ